MDAEMLGYKNLVPVADELHKRNHFVMIFGAEVMANQLKNDAKNGKRRMFMDIEGLDDNVSIGNIFETPDLILTGIALRPGTGLNIVLSKAVNRKSALSVTLLAGYAGNLFKIDGRCLFFPDI